MHKKLSRPIVVVALFAIRAYQRLLSPISGQELPILPHVFGIYLPSYRATRYFRWCWTGSSPAQPMSPLA